MKNYQLLPLCFFCCFLIGSCSSNRKAQYNVFAPDFGKEDYDSSPIRLLRFDMTLSLCDNQTIHLNRPSIVTISQDAEIMLRVINDTISRIRVLKGSGRFHIQEISDYNSDEFSFTFSDYICDEQYQRFGPGLTLRIFATSGASDDVSIITKGNDLGLICD